MTSAKTFDLRRRTAGAGFVEHGTGEGRVHAEILSAHAMFRRFGKEPT